MILHADGSGIARAAKEIRAGRLVAFPTETVYGLGANALSPDAVSSIFALKGRPTTNPLIVHIESRAQIERYAILPESSEDARLLDLLSLLWPAPLSIVLPKRNLIPDVVTANQISVALRVPRHPVALALIREAAVPIAAPSANRSTSVSPTTAQHVEESFGFDAPLILDGGPCHVGLESTVVKVNDGKVFVLRHGGISKEELVRVCGVPVLDAVRHTDESDATLTSPGMLSKHYAPRTPLIIRSQAKSEAPHGKFGLVKFTDDATDPLVTRAEAIEWLSKCGNEEEIARCLFAALRRLDNLELSTILVDSCEEVGLGRAIMDRLKRGAAK